MPTPGKTAQGKAPTEPIAGGPSPKHDDERPRRDRSPTVGVIPHRDDRDSATPAPTSRKREIALDLMGPPGPAFERSRFDVYLMNDDGTNLRGLTGSPDPSASRVSPPAWSPDGTRIAYTARGDVYWVSVDGSAKQNLTNHPAPDLTPAWSPDGTRIAFASSRDGNSEIYVTDLQGAVTRVTNHSANDAFPAWLPEGDRVIFQSDRGGSMEPYLANADGTGNPTPAVESDVRLAFVSNRDGNHEIYGVNVDGAGLKRLTTNDALDADPAWSPDGRRIAFVSERDAGNREIYLMNADGSGQTNLTNSTAREDAPTWSPDGARIAFVSNPEGNYAIHVVTVTANPTMPTDLTGNLAENHLAPAWSPRGTMIAFYRVREL